MIINFPARAELDTRLAPELLRHIVRWLRAGKSLSQGFQTSARLAPAAPVNLARQFAVIVIAREDDNLPSISDLVARLRYELSPPRE